MRIASPIETERLILRNIELADVSHRYLDWLNNPAINRYLESRFVGHTTESLRASIEAMSTDATVLLLAIIERKNRIHIGNIKLGPIDPHHLHGPIGLVLDPAAWGKGYASEAIGALAAFAFAHLALEKAFAGCYASNIASLRAFEKAGFVREALLKDHWREDAARRVDGLIVGKARPQ